MYSYFQPNPFYNFFPHLPGFFLAPQIPESYLPSPEPILDQGQQENTSCPPVIKQEHPEPEPISTVSYSPKPYENVVWPGGEVFKINGGKTTAYTFEAFFASDGRSKNKMLGYDLFKPKYKCGECGKNYATSSNLSRHKQTHRILNSSTAKKCGVCGKMYVSMPALSMRFLTHSLSCSRGVHYNKMAFDEFYSIFFGL